MYNIILTATTIGFIYMLFVTPVYYALGITKMEYGDMFELSDRIKCLIPLYNVIHAERMYTGKVSKVMLSTLAFILLLALRIVVVFVLPSNFMVNVITIVLFLLSLVSVYVSNAYSVYIVLHDSGVVTMGSAILRSIVYPMGQWYIGSYLVTIVKNKKKGNVFNGKNQH